MQILVEISALIYCSDFFSLLPFHYCKGKMALGTSFWATIEKYSVKVSLGSLAISKMELFATLYDCHRELHLRYCRGPWSARGYESSFCIDHQVSFPCLPKKLCHYCFYFSWRFVHHWYIFLWKKKKFLSIFWSW